MGRHAPPDVEAPERTDAPGWSLEEFAELAAVPARTVRYYQAERLLPKPERDRRDGRVARYGDDHLQRLRLIGELRDRGLKLPAIRDLLESGDSETRVADWLGLDASLRGSWGPSGPRLADTAELDAILAAVPIGTRGVLEESSLLDRRGDTWLIPNPALFEVTVELVSNGVPVDLVMSAGRILQAHLAKAAEQLVDLFIGSLTPSDDVQALVAALRPAAGDGARAVFAKALEDEIATLLADTKRSRRR